MSNEKVMELFPVGSRVVESSYDREGVVVCYEGMFVGVDFGDTFSGHDLDGWIETHTGWWCIPESLRLVDHPPENEQKMAWNEVFV